MKIFGKGISCSRAEKPNLYVRTRRISSLVGQMWNIKGRQARVEQRQVLCRRRGIWRPWNVQSGMSGGKI